MLLALLALVAAAGGGGAGSSDGSHSTYARFQIVGVRIYGAECVPSRLRRGASVRFGICCTTPVPGHPGGLHGLRPGSPAFEGRLPQDWGRQGLHNQSAVAAVMGAVAHDARPDFVISTGDNFYNCAPPPGLRRITPSNLFAEQCWRESVRSFLSSCIGCSDQPGQMSD